MSIIRLAAGLPCRRRPVNSTLGLITQQLRTDVEIRAYQPYMPFL